MGTVSTLVRFVRRDAHAKQRPDIMDLNTVPATNKWENAMKINIAIVRGVAILFFLFVGKICLASTDFISAPMFSGLSTGEKQLLTEYHEHYTALKEHYENAFIVAKEELQSYVSSIEGQIVFRQEGEGPARVILCDYEYRANGEKYCRLQGQQIIKEMGEKDEDSVPRIRLGLVAGDRSYLFSKNKPESRYYSLNAMRKTGDPSITDSVYSYMFPFLAFSETGLLLEYLIFQKPPYAVSCEILSVVGVQSELGEIITVIMVALNKEGEKVSYRFEFLRDYRWVLKSSVVETAKTRKTTRNEYVFVDGNIPELKRSTIRGEAVEDEFLGSSSTEKLKLSYFRTFDIVETKFGPVALSEFDVSQFLPPGAKIGEITSASFSPARIAAIVVGVIFVIIGFYLRFRRLNKS